MIKLSVSTFHVNLFGIVKKPLRKCIQIFLFLYDWSYQEEYLEDHN